MILWYLLLGVIGIALLVLLLWGLHHGALWLEERGLLFYRHRKPGGTSSGWLGIQEFVEPQVKHVVEAREEHEHIEHVGGSLDQLFPRLIQLLRTHPPDREQIRSLLKQVLEQGADWREFLAQAAHWVVREEPDKREQLPTSDEVNPEP